MATWRNGAPFRDWLPPGAIEQIRKKRAGSDDGDRQMVKILAAALDDGLAAVEAARAEALADNVHSAAVILNILARRRDPPPLTIATPDALRREISRRSLVRRTRAPTSFRVWTSTGRFRQIAAIFQPIIGPRE